MASGRLAQDTPEPRFFFSRDVRILFCRLWGFSWNRPTPRVVSGTGGPPWLGSAEVGTVTIPGTQALEPLEKGVVSGCLGKRFFLKQTWGELKKCQMHKNLKAKERYPPALPRERHSEAFPTHPHLASLSPSVKWDDTPKGYLWRVVEGPKGTPHLMGLATCLAHAECSINRNN